MLSRFVKRHSLALLSRALHVANAKPAAPIRDQFYALKDRLLRRYGEQDGHDYQEINKKCWNCDSGVDGWDGGYCERCDGTGNYSTTYVKLERWRLGHRTFHRPVDRYFDRGFHYYNEPGEDEPPEWVRAIWRDKTLVTMAGRVIHKNYPEGLSIEASLWFILLFDFRVFWQLWRRGMGVKRIRAFTPIRFGFWLRSSWPTWRWQCYRWFRYTMPYFLRRVLNIQKWRKAKQR